MNRFGALVAALMLCASLCVPCFAAFSSVEASMPESAAFRDHPHSWYVWRKLNNGSSTYYELICSPIAFSGDYLSPSLGTSFSNSFYDVSYIAGDNGRHYAYACATPIPLKAYSSAWSVLPSFPVTVGLMAYASFIHFYPTSDTDLTDLYYYIVPLLSSTDNSVDFSFSSGDATDTVTSVVLDSPFLSYPFASRSYTSSSSAGYLLVGGNKVFASSNLDNFNATWVDLGNSYYLSHYDSLAPYPSGYIVPSSSLGVVFVRKPSGSYITSASSYSASVKGVFTLSMRASLLGDVDVGTWLSGDDLQNLQDQLVNDFDVDSGTLKNSKDNLNSWSSTSSIDTDVSSTASGLLGGVFQNLGTFLFSVSLLCFGAVVIRMLIKKAVI